MGLYGARCFVSVSLPRSTNQPTEGPDSGQATANQRPRSIVNTICCGRVNTMSISRVPACGVRFLACTMRSLRCDPRRQSVVQDGTNILPKTIHAAQRSYQGHPAKNSGLLGSSDLFPLAGPPGMTDPVRAKPASVEDGQCRSGRR